MGEENHRGDIHLITSHKGHMIPMCLITDDVNIGDLVNVTAPSFSTVELLFFLFLSSIPQKQVIKSSHT